MRSYNSMNTIKTKVGRFFLNLFICNFSLFVFSTPPWSGTLLPIISVDSNFVQFSTVRTFIDPGHHHLIVCTPHLVPYFSLLWCDQIAVQIKRRLRSPHSCLHFLCSVFNVFFRIVICGMSNIVLCLLHFYLGKFENECIVICHCHCHC